jgi:quercetin dioxygenase-like cupin family protein
MVNKKQPGSLPVSKSHSLKATVDIAVGAIVSRTLLRSEGGNLTVFAFDGGQSLAEHSAPFDAFVHLLEGELVVAIDGMEHALTPGDVIVMPADIPHAVRAPKPAKWVLVMLKGAE